VSDRVVLTVDVMTSTGVSHVVDALRREVNFMREVGLIDGYEIQRTKG
jgi:hypothetical protein